MPSGHSPVTATVLEGDGMNAEANTPRSNAS